MATAKKASGRMAAFEASRWKAEIPNKHAQIASIADWA